MRDRPPPPPRGGGRAFPNPATQDQEKRSSRSVVQYAGLFGKAYAQRLAQRWHAGLLNPFACANCGSIALDPVGSLGKGWPTCGGYEVFALGIELQRGVKA
jgi:hypothetical protein